jgi:hypothetical protein
MASVLVAEEVRFTSPDSHSTPGRSERVAVSQRAEAPNRRCRRRGWIEMDGPHPTCRSDAKIRPSLRHPTRS